MLHLVTWMLLVRNGLPIIQEKKFLELPAHHPSFLFLLKHVKFLCNIVAEKFKTQLYIVKGIIKK